MKTAFRIVCGALGVGLVSLLAYVATMAATGNFHPVVAEEVYRSAQPSPAAIARYRSKYNVRTIINLRGENRGSAWYDDEVATARKLGIQHIDFRVSARHGLSKEEAWQLIQIMEQAPKPLLIHCESGVDRSGLASALYLAGVKRASEKVAERQLSIRYGHIALPFAKGWGMTTTFEEMEPSLGYRRS